MKPAPIALFAYNRPEHLARTLAALRRNELAAESDLHVFADGAKSPAHAEGVARVREILRDLRGFRSISVTAREQNWGLARSIISGVSQMVAEHGRVIVVEDDLHTSPYFLRYLNEALELYAADDRVVSAHAYVYPVARALPETFFLRGADCWGWATWRRGWQVFNPDGTALLAQLEARGLTGQFDFNRTFAFTEMLRRQIAGKNDSWAIRWYASAFLADKLTLYPGISLVRNIGMDASGAHCGTTTAFDTTIADRHLNIERQPLLEAVEGRLAFEGFFRRQTAPKRKSWLTRIFGQ